MPSGLSIVKLNNCLLVFDQKTQSLTFALPSTILRKEIIRDVEPMKGVGLRAVLFSKEEMREILLWYLDEQAKSIAKP